MTGRWTENRSRQWAQPQRRRVPPVQFVFVVQSTEERWRTAAILLVVEVVADQPGMVEMMRAVSWTSRAPSCTEYVPCCNED